MGLNMQTGFGYKILSSACNRSTPLENNLNYMYYTVIAFKMNSFVYERIAVSELINTIIGETFIILKPFLNVEFRIRNQNSELVGKCLVVNNMCCRRKPRIKNENTCFFLNH